MTSPPVRYVSVVCPVCHARLDERLNDSPRTVKCPDCFTPLPVPSASEEEAARAREPVRQQPEVEPYRLQSTEPAPTEKTGKTRQPLTAIVICRICEARLHCQPRRESYTVVCPDCHEPVRVPTRAVVQKRYEEARRRPPDPVEPLPVPEPPPQPELKTDHWEVRAALPRVEEIPDPPRWTFFSDVWLFVFHREMLSRWIFLSIGIAVFSALVLFVMSIYSGVSGYGGVALAFFILPAFWIGIWTASYAASCWLVILEDTAGGNRNIYNWHLQNWREWVLHAAYVLYLLSVALIVGHGLGRLAELAGIEYWLLLLPTVVLLFPIVVLSALQSTEWWVPLTRPILTSLWSEFPGWVLFYLLSTGLLLAAGALFRAGLAISPLFCLPFTAPILAAAWFTYGRLLGRLGWLISSEQHGNRQRNTR